MARHAPDLAAVALINIALGWTLAGWVVALGMALRTPASPALVQVYQGPPPIPPPAGPLPRWHGPPGPPARRDGEPSPLPLPPHPPCPGSPPPGQSPA